MSCVALPGKCLLVLFIAWQSARVGCARIMDFMEEEAKHFDILVDPLSAVAAVEGQDEKIPHASPTIAATEPSTADAPWHKKSMLVEQSASNEPKSNAITSRTAIPPVTMHPLPLQVSTNPRPAQGVVIGLPSLATILLVCRIFVFVCLLAIIVRHTGLLNHCWLRKQIVAENPEEKAKLLDWALNYEPNPAEKAKLLDWALNYAPEDDHDDSAEVEPTLTAGATRLEQEQNAGTNTPQLAEAVEEIQKDMCKDQIIEDCVQIEQRLTDPEMEPEQAQDAEAEAPELSDTVGEEIRKVELAARLFLKIRDQAAQSKDKCEDKMIDADCAQHEKSGNDPEMEPEPEIC